MRGDIDLMGGPDFDRLYHKLKVLLLLDSVPCQAKRCKLRTFSNRMGYTYVRVLNAP